MRRKKKEIGRLLKILNSFRLGFLKNKSINNLKREKFKINTLKKAKKISQKFELILSNKKKKQD
jgi:hypothetical protein